MNARSTLPDVFVGQDFASIHVVVIDAARMSVLKAMKWSLQDAEASPFFHHHPKTEINFKNCFMFQIIQK